LSVSGWLDPEDRASRRRNVVDGNEVDAPVCWTVDAEGVDLVLVSASVDLWVRMVGVGARGREDDDSVPESSGLALDALEDGRPVIDDQVVSGVLSEGKKYPITMSYEAVHDRQRRSIADVLGMLH
jgi:hypothetical protein